MQIYLFTEVIKKIEYYRDDIMKKGKEEKIIAIYLRVSTLDQVKDGYSLDMQERTLKKWCNDNKYIIYRIYADKGISGKDITHRPAMRELIEDASKGKFNIVIFWALSRFTRSVSDLYNTMTKFQKWNISMISYTESFNTSTPMGRAMIGIVGVFAQLERELTGERVAASMEERAIQGKRTCSSVLGYDKYGKDSFEINKKEAEYVRFCFEEYLIRKNLSEVATLARERGYLGKRGKMPTAWSIEKLITRPIYCGYNIFHGRLYKGNFEPIVNVDIFNKVQTLLKKQGKTQGRARINEIFILKER